jgi:pimeloyl-ACP methyl ester carboxylesterase
MRSPLRPPARPGVRDVHNPGLSGGHRGGATGDRCPADRALGVSYGTKVAVVYALRYPQHVDRLALDSIVEPGGPAPSAWIRSQRPQGASRALPRRRLPSDNAPSGPRPRAARRTVVQRAAARHCGEPAGGSVAAQPLAGMTCSGCSWPATSTEACACRSRPPSARLCARTRRRSCGSNIARTPWLKLLELPPRVLSPAT